MECQYRSRNGRLVFKIEGAGHKDIFESIASVQEVFESDESCGLCSGPNLRYVVRTAKKAAKEFTYFELRCADCGARFEFGQAQDMKSLFPKRNRDAQGNETEDRCPPNRGWYKYAGNTPPYGPHSAPDDPGEEEDTGRAGARPLPTQPIRAAREEIARGSRTINTTGATCTSCNAPAGKAHADRCAQARVAA